MLSATVRRMGEKRSIQRRLNHQSSTRHPLRPNRHLLARLHVWPAPTWVHVKADATSEHFVCTKRPQTLMSRWWTRRFHLCPRQLFICNECLYNGQMGTAESLLKLFFFCFFSDTLLIFTFLSTLPLAWAKTYFFRSTIKKNVTFGGI